MSAPRDFIRRASAYTLAELVVAMGVSSILVVGAGVVLTSTVGALDRGADAANATRATGEGLDVLRADLAVATTFYERTATSLEFDVPDRDGDASPERIRYDWSGTPGAPLQRRVRTGSKVDIIPDVQSLNFKDLSRAGPTYFTSGLVALATSEAPSGSTPGAITLDDPTKPFAAVIRPAFPANTSSWQPTSVRLWMSKKGAASGSTIVRLVTCDAFGYPTSNQLASATIPESTLGSSYAVSEVMFNPVPAPLGPGQRVAITLTPSISDAVANIQTVTLGAIPASITYMESTDSGQTWVPQGNVDIKLVLLGTYTTRTEQ